MKRKSSSKKGAKKGAGPATGTPPAAAAPKRESGTPAGSLLSRSIMRSIRPRLLREPLTPFHESLFGVLDHVDTLQQELENLFWMQPHTLHEVWPGLREPFADIIDRGDGVLVQVDLPGIAAKDLKVRITPTTLELKAEAEGRATEKGANFIRRERGHRSYFRTIHLPRFVNPKKAAATLESGVLHVTAPWGEKGDGGGLDVAVKGK